MSGYRILYLDLDNTVFDFTRSEARAVSELMRQNGIEPTEERVACYSAVNRRYWERYERGEIPREAIFVNRFATFLEEIGVTGDAEKMAKQYFVLLSEGHDLMPGAVPILAWLRENGYRVYATTNGVAKTQIRRLREAGIYDLFDAVFISEEVGSQKPDPAYFAYVNRAVGMTDPKTVLVVGDSPSSDLLGGQQAGLATCWFNPKGSPVTVKPTYEIKDLEQLKTVLE